MEPIEYLRAFRRRWKIVAACVLVALGAGYVLTAGDGGEAAAPTRTFEASTYLLPTTTAVSVRGGGTMATAARRVTLGAVSQRAADVLNYDGEPDELAANVTAGPEEDSGLLKITATAPSAFRARLIADTFAEQLLVVLRADTEALIQALEDSIQRLERQIARQDEAAAEETPVDETPVDDPRTGDERATDEAQDADDAQLAALEASLSQLVASTTGHPAGFDIIERAFAEEVTPEPSGGIQAPESRTIRLLIAAALGLLLGLVIAFLLERLDTRIRSKHAAEDIFRLPVLAEIPSISRRRRRTIVASAFPHAPASNAFRLLAAALQFGRHEGAVRSGSGGGQGAPRTILVTSATPGEGKSTVVSNLAATFAEVGKRVVVLCCDFRHPTLHRTFGVEQGPGLAEELQGDAPIDLESMLQDAKLERVRVAATGMAGEHTAALFGSDRMHQLLAKARDVADIVLIDTAPVLSAGDWTQLLPEVDAVLVVARVGKTDASTAASTAEVLAILQAPVVGVALNEVPRGSLRRTRYPVRFRFSRRHDDKRAPAIAAAAGTSADASGSARGWTSPDGQPAIPSGATTPGPKPETGNPEREGATKDGGIPHLVRPSSKE